MISLSLVHTLSSHHIHLHSTHKTKHSTCRYTHPEKVSETQSYQNRPYFSIRDETASYVMNVIACPGIMRISRGVIPFHKAGVPSSLAMTMQDCNRLLYCFVAKGSQSDEQTSSNTMWHDTHCTVTMHIRRRLSNFERTFGSFPGMMTCFCIRVLTTSVVVVVGVVSEIKM